jgi:hypothetical protein
MLFNGVDIPEGQIAFPALVKKFLNLPLERRRVSEARWQPGTN